MIAKDRLTRILICLALALGTALLYLPVLHFDYVNYDDPIYIIDNFHIRTVTPESLAWCFQLGYASLWHPLTWLSHMLDFQLYGLQHPGGHHATSVIFHIFNSTLLFVVLQRMTKAVWPSAMVAALFAWHPLHVESVAWISERKDVLSAFFWLLTVWAYVRYVEICKAPGLKSTVYYSLALVFFALGLMSKPMIVTLPFVLLLLDWWPLRRTPFAASALASETKDLASQNPGAVSLGRLLVEKIPFLLFSMVASFFTLRAAARMVEPLGQYPLFPRLGNAALACFHYIEKMVWPTDLVVIYPYEFHPPRSADLVTAALFLVLVTVAAIRLSKKRSFWLTGWLLYLGMLVPVIGLVHVGAHLMADHNAYLPAIGIFMIICWEAADIAAVWPHGNVILGVAAALILGACAVLTSRQLQYWQNPATLFAHNIAVAPGNYVALDDYAAFLRDCGKLDEAQKDCEAAIQIFPNYGWSHQVLGGVFTLQGKYKAAEKEFQTGLRLDPGRVDIHMALGQVALYEKQGAEAAREFSLMLGFDPSSPQALVGLGQALAMQGKLDEARSRYAQALRVAPAYPEAHHQMAVVLGLQHKVPEAVAEYRAALTLQPNRTDSMNNLAWILATDPHPEFRQGPEAVKLAFAACALTQEKQPMLLGTLAAAYAEAGSFKDAVLAGTKAHDVAASLGDTNLAARNLNLVALYRAGHPYHEQ